MRNKRGQITIFIIIAIILVTSVALFFAFRGSLSKKTIPQEIEPIYSQFLFCIEENTLKGISTMEAKAGYIQTPSFERGSSYMPFSSHLNFMGVNVPYWYYVSGNNLVRENVPSKKLMESQLSEFLEKEIIKCDFTEFVDQGYYVTLENPKAKISIKDENVDVDLKMSLTIEKEDSNFYLKNSKVSLDSDLGKLYDSAVKIYKEEQNSMFLENYTLDLLRYYAPVDGVEFSCKSKIWNVYEIFEDVQTATHQNLGAVSIHGNSDDYFVLNFLSNKIPTDVYLNLLTSSEWPTTFEVEPSEGPILMANPIGNQYGLGAIGFCYLTYHFVYDYKYPVMVQIHSTRTDEIFQFPTAVVIEKSNARKSLGGEGVSGSFPEICENANTEFEIITLDSNSRPIDAEVSIECASQRCDIGKSKEGIINGLVPQCVNGYIFVYAEGYKPTGTFISTMEPGSLTVFLDRKYEKEFEIYLDSKPYYGEAIITFEDEFGNANTLLYPSQNRVELSEGEYKILVSTYTNVSIDLETKTQEYCVDVPRNVLGIFGFTKKECIEIEVPDTLLSKAVSGGGHEEYYFLENNLRDRNKIRIEAEKFPLPDSVVQIQYNYLLLEDKYLEISLV